MGKEVRFKPLSAVINVTGFILGFFFANFLMPIFNAIISYISGGGEFPTQSMLGPVSNMVGPSSVIIIGIVGIMLLLLAKKLMGFALWLLIGLLLQAVLVAAGVPIPSLWDIIAGVF